nr:malto-oligosyltrehalose trehalohydrolase [Candidatus Acidoferrales bacterium]
MKLDEKLGAVWSPDGICKFLLWAPRAKKVDVRIEDARGMRTITLDALDRGYFFGVAKDVSADALYQYVLDGKTARPDPVSQFQPRGVHGPSQVMDGRFDWNDKTWRGLELKKYVLYELHVGTFTPEGTFDAIIPRIANLKQLGITAIELMPIAQFPGARNWGYDGTYPFAVQDSYGGPVALKRLVNACHEQGMAVVLDVVYNHLGPEGNYLGEFAPYFTEAYRTPWGAALNFDGPYSDEVRRYFIQNALQWIQEFHFDGLRLDAINAIVDTSARKFLEELSAECHAAGQKLNRPVYLIAESDRNDAKVVEGSEVGGWGLDASWNDDFHHALHVLMTGERNGYYEDYSGVEDLARAFRDGFIYAGQYSTFRQKRHGTSTHDLHGEHFVVFSQDHDQIGNRMLADRYSQTMSLEKLKLAAAVVLLSPYVPMLFMGEEYGEPAPFQYFVSHEDKGLIEAVRKGREEEFARFQWATKLPDPQAEDTFLRSKMNWELQNGGKYKIIREFYRELLDLRAGIPALSELSKNDQEVVAFAEQTTLFIRRWSGESQVCIAFHFGGNTVNVDAPIPEGRWTKILDSANPMPLSIDGRAAGNLDSSGVARLDLRPWQLNLFVRSDSAKD